MKKLLLILPIFCFALGFYSCDEDESLSPLPPKVQGQFMNLDIDYNHRYMDFDNIENTYFGGMLSNPSNTVVKFELYVRRSDRFNVITSDYKLLETYTSFPTMMKITPAKIAAVYEMPVSELQNGDSYYFLGYSYNAAGQKVGYLNLSRSVQIADFLEQAYKFRTILTDGEYPDFNNRDI